MAKEYLEREPILKQIRAEGVSLLEQEGRRTNEVLAYGHCFGIVDSAPAADVVEVVRCKDCRWSRTNKKDDADVYYCDLRTGRAYHSSDFCSYGERRSGR